MFFQLSVSAALALGNAKRQAAQDEYEAQQAAEAARAATAQSEREAQIPCTV